MEGVIAISSLEGLHTPVVITENCLKKFIPVEPGEYYRYVKLYYATYLSTPMGILKVRLHSSFFSKEFTIDASLLKDNEPVLFDLEDHYQEGFHVEVSAKLEQSSTPVALWCGKTGTPSSVLYKSEVVLTSPIDSPLISIITATYKTPLAVLEDTINSVLNQSNPNWEWIIHDDGSRDIPLTKRLNALAKMDARVSVSSSKKNKGISSAQNECLAKVKGEWFVVLDHDDMLHKSALYELAVAFKANPTAKIVYTDENKIGEDGVFKDPFYKPDWSPALLLCQNYINHLTAYKTEDGKRANPEGYESSFDGSQDYRYLLKYLTEIADDYGVVSPELVHHIPRVLYHWRVLESSVASDLSAKPYALTRARKAIEGYMLESGADASVMSTHNLSVYRPILKVEDDDLPHINIVIPTTGNYDVLRNCLESLQKTNYPSVYITLVDNGSDQKKAREVYDSCLPNIEDMYSPLYVSDKGYVFIERPFNFSYQTNCGADYPYKLDGELVGYDAILLLNNDTEVIDPNWLKEMASWLVAYPDVGAVGAKLIYPDGTLQHGGVDLGVGGIAGHSFKGMPYGQSGYFCRANTVHEVSAVTGACMLVRKSVYDEVGRLDEFLPQAFNDVDLCLKIREAGYRVLYTPHACLYHHESLSRGKGNHNDPSFSQAVKTMQDRWGHQLANDPYFNPNFSRESENYEHG